MSVLVATNSPSGSILTRASNSIKIERLNCDDPIRTTKRAPFLIRPRATRGGRYFACIYAKRVGQCSTFLHECKGGRERETERQS